MVAVAHCWECYVLAVVMMGCFLFSDLLVDDSGSCDMFRYALVRCLSLLLYR